MSDAPEPMTPRGCDLRGLPFMPLYGDALIDSDLFLLASGDEFKAALTLWWASWKQLPAGSLPNDERVLAGLARIDPRRWNKVRVVALRGWVLCQDGRLYHPFVARLATEAWEARQAQRARTEAARKARDERRTSSVTETATSSVTGSKCKGQGQGQSEEKSPSQGGAIHNGRGGAGASVVALRAGDR